MPLGTFTMRAKGKASSFDPRVNHGKPLIVVPREFRKDFTTPRFPTPKDVVIVDVVDLLSDTVLISVIWGGGAMVDAVKEHVPTEGEQPTKLPVMIKPATSATGSQYFVLAPLEGQALQVAQMWDAKFPQRIDQERVRHEAEQLAQANTPAADPMAAALAALQGQAAAQSAPAPAGPIGGDPAIAALQAQLAAALAAQGNGGSAAAAPAPAALAQPAMSDADLEAAIAALK